jgi:hypothetical protein
MSSNPYVIGIVRGDPSEYGAPLHATPHHGPLGARPSYDADEMWRFKGSHDGAEEMDAALEYLYDRSLTAEVHRFREANQLAVRYMAEIGKLEERMWEATRMRETSIRRLESADALARIDAAATELHRRREARERAERGRPA